MDVRMDGWMDGKRANKKKGKQAKNNYVQKKLFYKYIFIPNNWDFVIGNLFQSYYTLYCYIWFMINNFVR